jgi:hypothetical protein
MVHHSGVISKKYGLKQLNSFKRGSISSSFIARNLSAILRVLPNKDIILQKKTSALYALRNCN